MSTVFEVTSVSVDGGAASTFDAGIDTITIENAFDTPNVTISTPQDVEIVEVQVPGIQGPPGLQNVFVSDTAPSTPTLNDIWIEI
jgi:hypothetical protein